MKFGLLGWLLLATLSNLAFSAETIAPKLAREYINRPFTLPKGLHRAELWVFNEVTSDNLTTDTTFTVPVPVYDLAISDDTELVFFPLPVGIKHEFLRNTEQQIGFSFFLGYSYRDTTGFKLRPTGTAFRRQYLLPTLSLDMELVINPVIPLKSGNETLFSSSLTLGPLWQVHRHIGLRPTLTLALSQAPYLPPGTYVEMLEARRRPASDTRFTLPIGLWAGFSVSDSIDLSANFVTDAIGQAQGYKNTMVALKGMYTW